MEQNITCTMRVQQLVLILKKNRKTHMDNYKKAMGIFKKKVQAKLAWMAKAVAAGKRIHMSINLLTPMKYDQEYDRVIFMLYHTTNKSITLSEVQYRNYVMDKWDWQRNFMSNTMSYANGSTGCQGPAGNTGVTGATGPIGLEEEFGKIEDLPDWDSGSEGELQ